MARRRTVRTLWTLGSILAVLAFAKLFVADVYRVRSGSMRPTVFGELGGEGPTDWVLVRYGRPELRRFDLVVIRSAEGDGFVVKRVAGLPGESVWLQKGDLLIDGRRLGPEAPRPAPVPVFDLRHQSIEEDFHYVEGGPWQRAKGVWALDGTDVPPGSNQGMMFFQPDLRDDHLTPDGRRVPGIVQVNDAVLECEVAFDDDATVLRFLLVEEGDTFELELVAADPDDGSRAVVLSHRTVRSMSGDPAKRVSILATERFTAALGEWVRLRFSNVDDELTVELPGQGVRMRHGYGGNEALDTPGGELHRGPRVGLGGHSGKARLRSLAILRDLYYTALGEHAIEAPLSLGPDELFLLGDHSAHSLDSRSFGPVRSSDLVGWPVAVVWPLAPLRGTGGGPRAVSGAHRRRMPGTDGPQAGSSPRAMESTTDPGIELMLAYQAGEERAFDRLVERYSGPVYALLTRFLGPVNRREDLVQEVFLRVIGARERYRPAARFSTWLYRITFNLCVNERGRRSADERSIEGLDPEDAAPLDWADRSAPEPGAALERDDLVQAVRAAIAALPERQRMAMILARYHELPYAEIAEVLDSSEKAIKSMVHRARETLRETLAPYMQEGIA